MSSMTTARNKKFKDTSTDCAICLSSLDEHHTLELSCGHVYHLTCLQEQLEHAQPQYSQRLLFSGTRCAKCSRVCDHPDLQHWTRTTDALRRAVDEMIMEQLQIDHPEYRSLFLPDNRSRRSSSGVDNAHLDQDRAVDLHRREEERRHLMDQGRRNYAFYLCSSCHDPYFGGTVECPDQENGELVAARDRLCPTCAPQSQSIGCTNPIEHRGYHVWKCRCCCQVSNHVCYGTTHFCQSCHDRNSIHVRQQRQQPQSTRHHPPPSLEPIPCPGRESCPFPFPSGSDIHANGPSSTCEQVYFCAWCHSTQSINRTGAAHPNEPGSRNWIVNPSGELGLRGWTQHNHRGMSWQVEDTDIPLDSTTTTNFVSSFHWCVQSQAVPLGLILRQPARLEVSCRFMGRTDCPSVFRMEAFVLGRHSPPQPRPPVLQQVSTSQLETCADFWETARLTFPDLVDPEQAQALVFVVAGKDRRFWAGNFGAKVAACSLRVLGDPEELARVLQPDADERMEERVRSIQRHQHQQQQPPPRNAEASTSLSPTASPSASCSIS